MPLNRKSKHLKLITTGVILVTSTYFLSTDHEPYSVNEEIANDDLSKSQETQVSHAYLSWRGKEIAKSGDRKPKITTVKRLSTPQSEKGLKRSARKAFLDKLAQLSPLETRAKVDEHGAQMTERLYYRPDYADPFLLQTTTIDKDGKELTNVVIANEFLFQADANSFDENSFRKRNPQVDSLVHVAGNSWRIGFALESLDARDKIKESLNGAVGVKGVYPNRIYYASAVPNDKFYTYLWASSNDGSNPLESPATFSANADANIEDGWDVLTDCRTIPVAVLDTGIAQQHPELKDFINVEESRNFSDSPAGIEDLFGHGTHVAGTIGAAGNNDEGVAGVCWRSELIVIKTLGDDGTGSGDVILSGFAYAATTSAKVLNASLSSGPVQGVPTDDPNDPYFAAIKSIEAAGQILVASAGNENNDNDAIPVFPVSFESDAIIGVGALNPDNSVAGFSNFGETVDIAAPGVAILSTWPQGVATQNPFMVDGVPQDGYSISQGTSMASPLVAGIAALYWAMSPNATAQEVKAVLLDNSVALELNKVISGGRTVDMTAVMDTVRVEFSTQGKDTLEGAAPKEEITLGIEVTRTGLHALDKLQVFMTKRNGEELILNEVPIDSGEINFEMPLKVTSNMGIRVTDVDGRVYDDLLLEQALLRFIDFDAISGLSGDTTCGINIEGKSSASWEGQVENTAACESLCEAILPMLLSNKKIDCGVQP